MNVLFGYIRGSNDTAGFVAILPSGSSGLGMNDNLMV